MVKEGLFLLPSFIGESANSLLPQRTIETIYSIEHFIVEKEKTTRKFLKLIGHPTPQSDFKICQLDKHNNYSGFEDFLLKHAPTVPVGLLSEAGLACIADPGSSVVRFAHKNKISVKPLSGSSSILLALISSGFNGQSFQFHGYLPKDKALRKKRITMMESNSRHQTHIFIETPYNNQKLFQELKSNLNPETPVCLAFAVESENELILTGPISKLNYPNLSKTPCVFLIGN